MSHTEGRRVIGNISMSLDGRVSGPGGEYDMGFILPYTRSGGTRAVLTRLTEATTAVVGRKAFEGFEGFWPVVARDPGSEPRDRAFAKWLDRVEKVVVSNTLTEPKWQNSRAVSEDPVTLVRRLRAEPGADIVVLTSQTIIRQLLAADELDRLSINLVPELVGAGARLFTDDLPGSSWRLTESHHDESGAIWLIYDRVRDDAATSGSFTLRRTLDASVTDAWRAWADGRLVQQWWGPAGFTCTRADVDFRVGGFAYVSMQAPPEFGGFTMHNRWEFTVIDKPTHFEFVSTFVDEAGNPLSPTDLGLPSGVPDQVPHEVDIAPAGENRTELTLTEHGYTDPTARAQSEAGQAEVLDKMQALFARSNGDGPNS